MDELRRCAELYALGADRRDKALWASVMTEDLVLEGPGFRHEGREAVLGLLDVLDQMFRKTQHQVFQVVASIEGERARGETYCSAQHLLKDQDALLVWAIRYQDEWCREDGAWRFSRRQLIVDWEEVRPIKVETGQ